MLYSIYTPLLNACAKCIVSILKRCKTLKCAQCKAAGGSLSSFVSVMGGLGVAIATVCMCLYVSAYLFMYGESLLPSINRTRVSACISHILYSHVCVFAAFCRRQFIRSHAFHSRSFVIPYIFLQLSNSIYVLCVNLLIYCCIVSEYKYLI